MSKDQTALYIMFVERMSVCLIGASVDELSVNEMSVDEITVDEMSVLRCL